MKIHPSDLLLEEMLFSPCEDSSLFLHLASCAHCRLRVGALPNRLNHLRHARQVVEMTVKPSTVSRFRQVEPGSSASADYNAVIERSERTYLERARSLARERSNAVGLLGDLVGHAPEQRCLVLANSARYHTWGLYELLLERSWIARTADRTESEGLAHLALQLSRHLDPHLYTAELIEDLRARAWSYIGNLYRIAADLGGAEEAFQESYAHLKRGTREPLERALYLDLKASLRRAQRRLDESAKLLGRAIAIFRRQGDEHRAGRSLVSLAAVYVYSGEPDAAIAVLEQALKLIDATQDERLVLSAWHNLIDLYASGGRFIEAQGLYRKARALYRANKDVDLDLRRLWVKGKIERGLGQHESAEELFLAAREGFLTKDFPYEAALVSMELATLYAQQGRTPEVKQLAAEMLPIFASRHIHREALAALTFLTQAIEAERLNAEVINSVAAYLRRAETDPGLKFEGT